MLNKISAALLSVTLACMLGACSMLAPEPKIAASDITPRRDLSSWCQGDKPVSYAPAPAAGADDPGNQFDTDETVKELQAHNARYRAACPAEPQP